MKPFEQYQNQLRVRVMGWCVRAGKLLVLREKTPKRPVFWLPPGGGLTFGEPLAEAVRRELREETGLLVKVQEVIQVGEYISPPFHAVELLYRVEYAGGKLQHGTDPEHPPEEQSIQEVVFLSRQELQAIPEELRHPFLADKHLSKLS